MRNASTLALALMTVGVAALDWMVAGTTAQPGVNAEVPTAAPPLAVRTGEARGNVGGCELRVLAADGGYRLVAHNPSTSEARLGLDLEIYETNSSPLARIGPIPLKVGSERVDVIVAAGATVERTLAYRDPPPASAGANVETGALPAALAPVRTVSFHVLGPPPAPGQVPTVLAILRPPDAPAGPLALEPPPPGPGGRRADAVPPRARPVVALASR